MARQAADLAELLADPAPATEAAGRLRGRARVLLCGTGTSYHAAQQGAWMLRAAGFDAWGVTSGELARDGGPALRAGDALVVLSHTGAKRDSLAALERGRGSDNVETLTIGGRQLGDAVDVPTVEAEQSSAYTASHLGALLRLAQIADGLGAPLGDLEALPEVVAAALDGPGPGVAAPQRLLEFAGPGPNAWTAAEGAMKVREACYIATEGLDAEQFFHGPAVALDARDTLVALDGGGPGAARMAAVADAVEATGADVVRIGLGNASSGLVELLSIFPLTVAVHRIALELAEALGTNPDDFRYDGDPAREARWEAVGF